MALDPMNSNNLDQLALKGLNHGYAAYTYAYNVLQLAGVSWYQRNSKHAQAASNTRHVSTIAHLRNHR